MRTPGTLKGGQKGTQSSPIDVVFQTLVNVTLKHRGRRAGTARHIGKTRGCQISSTVDHNGGHIISNIFPLLIGLGPLCPERSTIFHLRIWPKCIRISLRDVYRGVVNPFAEYCQVFKCVPHVGTSMSPLCGGNLV